MPASQSIIVASATLTLWRRGLASSLSLTERAVVAVGFGFLTVTAALGATLFWILEQFFSQIDPSRFRGDSTALMRLVLAGVFVGTLVFLLALSASAPQRTLLDNVLRMLPVRRRSRVMGTFVPVVALGFVFSLCLGIPSLAVVFQLGSGGAFSLAGLLGFLWLILWSAVAWPMLFFLARGFVTRVARLPSNYALAAASLVCIACGALLAARDLIPVERLAPESWWQALTPTRVLAQLLVGADGHGSTTQAWVAILAWTLVAVALVWAFLRSELATDERTTTRVLVGASFPRGSFAARLWLEAIVIVRLPQFLVTSLAVLLGTAAFPLLYGDPRYSAVVDQLASLVVVVPAAIGIYSFGATAHSHWIARLTTGRSLSWVVPKIVASLIVPVAMIVPYVVLLALRGMPVARITDVLSLGFAMFATAALVGVLVPFLPGQALSATITSATTTVTWALLVVASRWVTGQLNSGDPAVGTVVAAGLMLLAVPLAVRRDRGPTSAPG